MIVEVVDPFHIGSVEPENQAPVAVDGYRPEPLILSRQTMKAPACRIHILLGPGTIQRAQHQAKLASVMRLDSGRAARFEKTLDALVPEGLDH